MLFDVNRGRGGHMRSMWKGSIVFGLVNIPVKLYVATQDQELKFNLLHKKDNSEIKYVRICKQEEKEVPWNEIVKGYEVAKGEYVVFDDKDFEKVDQARTKTIDIQAFVNADEIDSAYYMKPYFLEPEKNGSKAYALLREALQKSKKVGLAKFVLRNREHLGVIKAYEETLVLNQIRYQEELLQPKSLDLPAGKAAPKELDLALDLINRLTIEFNPHDYKDTYVEEVKEMIMKKAKGLKIQPKKEPVKRAQVHDLMGLLKASLSKKEKKSTAATPKRKKKAA